MSKRTLVLDSSTGRPSYTNHPERLIRRGFAVREGSALRILQPGFAARLADAEADVEFTRNHGKRCYWNGSDQDPAATHWPGAVRS